MPEIEPAGTRTNKLGRRAAAIELVLSDAFDITAAKKRLAVNGGYEIIHESAGLEIGVYVFVAPEPDHQQPHAHDKVYVVLEGRGTLDVEGRLLELREGQAAFVPAGAAHHFAGYEQLSVLVIFAKDESRTKGSPR